MKKIDVLFALIAAVVIAAALYSVSRRRDVEAISCGNHMSSIGIATRVWAEDNHNMLPGNFMVMSNELATTKVLICPADRSREPALNWASFTTNNSSYALVTPGAPWNSTNAFLRCLIHGHLGYADGTVFDGKRRRTKIGW